MFATCSTCGGDGAIYEDARKVLGYLGQPGSRVWRAECSNPACVGGRVVSQPVIEEMGRALQQMWEADAERDEDPYEWDELTGDEKRFWETWAGAAARVVLEHMEDNERTTG